MNSLLFSQWFKKCFIPFVVDRKPALLIFDGHSSHINVDVVKESAENDITIIKLPAHTTDILQPIDVAINKSLKDRWDEKLVKWQRANPRKRIPKQLFVDTLNKVLSETPNSAIINGFRKTGIFDMETAQEGGSPVNRAAVDQKIFKKEDLDKYMKFKEEQAKAGKIVEVDIIEGLNENPAEQNNNDDEISEDVNRNPEESRTEIVEPESTIDRSEMTTKVVVETLPSSAGHSFEKLLLDYINVNKSHDIPNTSRKRACPNAEVLTTPDFLKKKAAEEEAAKQKLAEKENKLIAKQKKTVTCKLFFWA